MPASLAFLINKPISRSNKKDENAPSKPCVKQVTREGAVPITRRPTEHKKTPAQNPVQNMLNPEVFVQNS